ncbi:hypothetical protein BO78DRAFT_413930 [Aspergillus sclerotiicarbonarius CBS 121057]|uniref:CorA-like transporter domain-containing protein n=1 Tax=Aspergillus sclerotiicarbonarius (strain CBS 121057 / IBT 28362) TaxID=1448318 RepID=A0A319EMI1_ASPSB|nr:hypothetical protein BO78DRAFT_413930 [Aspergillus sclerotiicarbonarius CBS 121057]
MTPASDSLSLWRPYLHELPVHHDPAFVNIDSLEKLLSTRTTRVLTSRNETRVRVTDVYDDHRGSSIHTTPESLHTALTTEPAIPDGVNVRIISIYSPDSIAPLKISPPLMALLLQRYAVHPAFLQVLFSFGRNVHIAEAGSSHVCVDARDTDTYISYQVNYVEEKQRRFIPWSWRHTGVYHHRHQPGHGKQGYDLFILLQPNETGVLDKRILSGLGILAGSRPQPSLDPVYGRDYPILLHSVVLSSFTCNWRWYLRHLGDQFEEYNNKALVALPEESTPRESYDMVSALRDLNDSALRAQICCRGNLDLVSVLKPAIASSLGMQFPASWKQNLRGYEALESTLQGYLKSCEELVPRIRNAIDLAGYTLSLHNQLDTAKVDRELRDLINHLKDLQQDTVDDSAAVKIITFLSAVYLPGSFVVSVYGMNFFDFNDESRQIVIAKDFWVFLATWLPLTMATGLIYVLIVWFDAWWKRKPFRLFQRPGKESMSQSETRVVHGEDSKCEIDI